MSPRKESRPVEKDKADQSKQPIITLILRFAPSQNTWRRSRESLESPAARAFPSLRRAPGLCINRRAATNRVKPRPLPRRRKALRQAHFRTALSSAWPSILTQRFANRGASVANDTARGSRPARKNPSSTRRCDKVETCDWHHSPALRTADEPRVAEEPASAAARIAGLRVAAGAARGPMRVALAPETHFRGCTSDHRPAAKPVRRTGSPNKSDCASACDHVRHQPRRRPFPLQLVEGALRRCLVRAPAQQPRAVAEAVAGHLVVFHLDH